ncbi:unnamed protein product [Arctogadus glacialis]
MIFGADPCPDTHKYTQTTYTCLPAHHVVACEESEAELLCDSGQTIALIGAFYGRADRTTCIYGRPDGKFNKIDCFTRTANQVVAERCNGKSHCSVYAVNSVFQDACSGTAKYMELAYTCELLAAVCCLTYAENRVITCGDKTQRLSCDQGVVIVLKVVYGRTDNTTCLEDEPADMQANATCNQSGALEAVATRCNGKKACEVDKTIFGVDQCPKIDKSIRTTYKCLPAHHVVACEDSEVELLCDSGQTIALIGAFYGRADRTTCIYGRPDGKFNKIDCFYPTANQVVAERYRA